jgi:hypothetical protein
MTFIALNRSRSVVEIMRSTLRLYGAYPWLFLILAAGVVVPWELVRLALTGVGPFGRVRHLGFLERQSLDLLDLLLVSPLISAMHVHAVVAIGEGRRPRLAAVAWKGVRVLPVVGVAALIAGVGVEIGFFALVIPGVVLWVRLFVVPQAAAIEQDGVRGALRSSWRLTRHQGWHVLGVILLFVVVAGGVVLGARALDVGSGTSAGDVALGIALNTIIVSFAALMTALVYFDLLARREPTRAARAAVSS